MVRFSIGRKLFFGFISVVILMAISTVITIINVNSITQRSDHMLNLQFPVFSQSQNLMTLIRNEQQLITDYALTGNKDVIEEIDLVRIDFFDVISSLESLLLGEKQQLLDEIIKSELILFNDGQKMASTYLSGDKQAGDILMDSFDQSSTNLVDRVKELQVYSDSLMQSGMMTIEKSEKSTVLWSLIIGIVSSIYAIIIAIVLTRQISSGVKVVAKAARGLSVGDIQQEINIKSKDEIGDMADAFREMVVYIQGIANVADHLAQGDLTVNVVPKSTNDILSNSFANMIRNFRESLLLIEGNASSLSIASNQLAIASEQAGRATNQIATTVQQIAKGTSDQSTEVTKTVNAVTEMSHAIEGVAKGAQEQSTSMAKVSSATDQINVAIKQVASIALAVSTDSADASKAARHGASTVEQTLLGMQNIKVKVGLSAEKVEEMGKRSQEIGMIVETIEDIASQTNLLALNAAIEAARAGEHGKGFAVVADEVRKLAERSSLATKEIGELIKGILITVSDAVKAMEEGSKEVELGVLSANTAGSALQEIIKASEEVKGQSELAGEATKRMSLASEELVEAVDSVSAIVEENTASTEQMAANSSEVTFAIERIASVGEENSASIEEVSAGTEQMSAQVQEVTASAASLAEMALILRDVVARYKLLPE